MATYNKRTWETLNLPAVSGDTFFCICNRQTSQPGDDFNGRIYSGLCKDGYGIQNVNEILAQYVVPTGFSFGSSEIVNYDDASHSTFYIYYTQDDWESFTSDTVTLTYDWGYEGVNRVVKSDPITNILDCRQYFLHTLTATNPSVSETVNVAGIGEEWGDEEYTLIATFKIDGYSFVTYVRDLSTLVYPIAPTTETFLPLWIGSTRYLITRTCYRYCLYYLNQYGGWDSMLFRGKELQEDGISRLSYKKNYVANSLDFHKVDYQSTVSERWELNTSFLDDIASSKMINIMASNRLFLHDLETGRIAPVNVTNSTCEHKTYRNQGRKMAAYNVEVSASQPKYRV